MAYSHIKFWFCPVYERQDNSKFDGCYYHAPCVKMVNDKDFNSPLNFNFDTIGEAKREMSKMMQQNWD